VAERALVVASSASFAPASPPYTDTDSKMNHLKFWGSRSSSKTRDIKEEAKTSEPRKAEDKPEEAEQEPLDVVAPKIEVPEQEPEEGKTSDTGKEDSTQADEAEPAPSKTDGDDRSEASGDAVEKSSAAMESDSAAINAPGLPGGASTSAPHKREDVDTPEERSSKDDDSAPVEEEVTTSTSQEDEKAIEGADKYVNAEVKEQGPTTTGAPAEKDENKKNPKRDSAFAGNETKKESSDELKDAAAPSETQGPVLTEDDEQFLHRLTSEVEPQEPRSFSRRPTEINENGEIIEPTDVPLPTSPGLNEYGPSDEKTKEEQKTATWRDRWSQWSFVPAAPSIPSFRRAPPRNKEVSRHYVHVMNLYADNVQDCQ
jgi:hypothetical protein